MATRKLDPVLSKFILRRLEARIKYSDKKRSDQIRKWEMAEDSALAYMPETDDDNLRRADRENGGNPRYTTIQIPYSYATLMTAHTYLTSVFFARSPVHQFTGRHGETEQQVSALEAMISYQVESGGHLVPYYIWIYDSGKYGAGILGDYWCEETTQYSSVQEQVILDQFGNPLPGSKKKIQQTFQAAGYKGNKVYNVSPFDFGFDPHYPMYRFQEGEYCYVRKVMSWSEMIRRTYAGYYVKEEVDSLPARTGNTATIQEGSSALVRPDRTFQQDQGDEETKHPSSVDVYEMYVDLIQKEWRLGPSEYPEKWVFTLTSDYSKLLGAQPYGSAHGQFPFSILESEVEGYGLFSRGIPEIIRPIQNTMDWLINTHFFNVRAALNNQFIIDPSKIVIDDAEDGGAGFIYRLRPEAYGSDVRSFFYQIPVQDFTKQHMGDLDSVQNIGERITGINEQMFGGISKSRTTATEVRTSTGFGVNRLKTIAEYMSAMGMSPLASRLVAQSQQWYDGEQKFKIVGDLAQMAGERFMNVNPESISGNYDFVPVDGTLPVDRMAMATLWQNIMAQMRNFPPLMAQFDIGKIFTHVAQLGGIRNINQFKIQVVPDAVAQLAMQQGNVVPIGGRQGASGRPSYDSNVAIPPEAGAALAGEPDAA